MCQLTLLDFDPKTLIPRTFVRCLTELNAYGWSGKNDDGFGYMSFSKPGEIIKSNLDSISWWLENDKSFLRANRNANGIYHVRAASNNIKDTVDKDAHPFRAGNIILAHNGTMIEKKVLQEDEEMQKLFETDDIKYPMIDSEKFVQVLANIVGNNKLAQNHIDLAMENFTGPFCFLIYDLLQPKNVFVVRGKDRILHVAEFFDSSDKTTEHGKPIGIAINTGKQELLYWSKIVKIAMQQFSKISINVRVSELDEEHIWKYKIGSYVWEDSIGEIKQRPAEVVVYSKGNVSMGFPTNAATKSAPIVEPAWIEIVEISLELGLYMSEVFLMSEIIFGSTLHVLDEDSMEYFLSVMQYLKKQNFKGRKKEWEQCLKDHKLGPIDAYKKTGLEFPYVFSSKKDIRRKFNALKEKV